MWLSSLARSPHLPTAPQAEKGGRKKAAREGPGEGDAGEGRRSAKGAVAEDAAVAAEEAAALLALEVRRGKGSGRAAMAGRVRVDILGAPPDHTAPRRRPKSASRAPKAPLRCAPSPLAS